MNFVPTPTGINEHHFLKEISEFQRKMKLRSYFGTSKPDENTFLTKSTSDWTPSNIHHTVNTFLEDFNHKVMEQFEQKKWNSKPKKKKI